ncbi:MAG TPA: acetate/propionate family kinase [Candidatus Binataceae bacterium]
MNDGSHTQVNRTSNAILCVNSGSSSCKFALYSIGAGKETLIAAGTADRIGMDGGGLVIRDGHGRVLCEENRNFSSADGAIHVILDATARLNLPTPRAAGHRLVHGGPDHAAPERVTPQLMSALRGLIPFAPLHLPGELQAIDDVSDHFPGLPQAVCFDTAFHRRMPELAQRFALPRALWDDGIRRYGFHGISYEYIMQALRETPPPRVIIAHLGNGASMAAVRDGRPVDTTMGFTPAGGFMMGTRSGDLDPGVPVYLMKERGFDAAGLDRLVNRESGLLGVSGVTSDMKKLLELRNANPDARQAVAMFCYQLRKSIGALAAALGGLDLLVFTGGIGERAASVRWTVAAGLDHLGIRLDQRRNDAHADTISSQGSRCIVRVIPTNEDLMIARHTSRLLFK